MFQADISGHCHFEERPDRDFRYFTFKQHKFEASNEAYWNTKTMIANIWTAKKTYKTVAATTCQSIKRPTEL